MARRNQNADNLPSQNDDGDRINDGNEENTVETAAAEKARATKSDDLHEPTGDTTSTVRGEEEGPTGDTYTGGYPKSMEESYDGTMISVETTGDFQLYDPSTSTMFPHNKAVEVPENSQFVQSNIARGKLKKA